VLALIRELAYYTKMALGLAAWARSPVERDPEGLLHRTFLNRESNFLNLVRTAIFENPTNPYFQLFENAGCAYADLETMVRGRGLDPALRALYEAGIYLTHNEFKGRKPVQRGEVSIELDASQLANPAYAGVWETSSSGSRSHGSVTRRSLEYQVYREAQEHVLLSPHEFGTRLNVTLASILPATGGLRRIVSHIRTGTPVDAWFPSGQDRHDSQHYRAMTAMLIRELRLIGVPAVFPTYLPHNDYSPAARWIAEQRVNGRAAVVTGGVSPAVRVADAALAGGLDLSGTWFVVGGEALTEAKREVFERAGCEVHARYTISELGQVGIGCREMSGNCVHLSMDAVAVVSRKRIAPLSGVEVDSLLFTSLLPTAATVMINVEMDDAGIISETHCDCPLRRLGFHQQIDRIFSYGKLTGHSMTLLGGDMLDILERRLPSRFGGAPTDYQLVEREGGAQTEIELRVNPRLGLGSAEEVRRFVLRETRRLWGGALTAGTWAQSESFHVVFEEPYVTGGRKILPLHLLGTNGRGAR
jgi:hypothetical protein